MEWICMCVCDKVLPLISQSFPFPSEMAFKVKAFSVTVEHFSLV